LSDIKPKHSTTAKKVAAVTHSISIAKSASESILAKELKQHAAIRNTRSMEIHHPESQTHDAAAPKRCKKPHPQ